MQSINNTMKELFQSNFEAYMDEMAYDFIFEQMMPAIKPMVINAQGFGNKELSPEMDKWIHEQCLELCKLIVNDLVKDQYESNYNNNLCS